MLAVTDLDVAYGRAQVLFGLSLQVQRGEAVALLGRNGAGKSTTLKTVMGLLSPSAGTIDFLGEPLRGQPPHRIARAGIGYVPEERRVFGDLTILENLETGRQPPRADAPAWSAEDLFALFPNLAELRHRRAAQTSGGEQQMLSLARTLMGNPRLLLLDEPSEGLAPIIVEQMAASLKALKAEGLTLLLSEQNLRFASAIADRAYVIESGRLRVEGGMEEVARREQREGGHLAL